MPDDPSIIDFADGANPDPLSPGSDIHGYRINKVLGQGDYWFTYLANDLPLGRAAIITEYMPSEIAIRDPRGVIHAASVEHNAEYQAGLDCFLTDAQTLTTIKHHNIVQFLDSFDANNSAYLIVAHEQGKNLEQLFDSSNMEEEELLAIMLPILDGIEEIHARGFIHRYIQPSNIIVRPDGRPGLTGFNPGAGALFKPTSTTTKHFPPGFAPIEIHYGDSELQGAWTDVYSLGATFYQALVGVPPAHALERYREIVENRADPLTSAPQVGHGHYSNAFLKAIDHALCFFPTQRPLTVAAWRTEFAEKDSIDAVPTSGQARPSVAGRPKETSDSTSVSTRPLRPADGPLNTVLINDRAKKSADAADRPTASSCPREEMPGQRRGHWRAYSVSITGLVAAGLFLWWMLPGPLAQLYDAGRAAAVEWLFRSPVSEDASKALPDPSVQVPAIEQPMVDSAAQVGEGTAEESAVRGRGLEQQIDSLLTQAKSDVEAGRITHPQGSNAIEKYRTVLALKPDRAEATEAIQDLLERLLSAAREALDREQWDAAQRKLDEAAMIEPASTRVANLRDALNVRKSAALMQHVTEETRRLQSEEVVNKLVVLSRKALDANDMKMAEAHLGQAVAILPESDQVTKLRDELDTRKVRAQEALKSRAAERTNEEERTVRKLLDLARKAINEHDLQTARIYVSQAAAIRPDSSHVALVRNELASQRAQSRAESNAGQPSLGVPTRRQNTQSEKPRAAVQLTIQGAAPSRLRVQPGETVRFYTEYSLTLPASGKHAYVQATWALLKNGRRIGQEGMDYGYAKPGRNTAATELPLPSWTKPGRYTVEHRVQVGDSFDLARSHFVVAR
ncbi:MAG: protein kinase domain-containing protein [Gammaproteobacteria bacterium]